jgi:hypothetical protein
MELPTVESSELQQKQQGSQRVADNPTIEHPSLTKLFDAAQSKYKQDADQALSFLTELRSAVAGGVSMFWGHRMVDQVKRYVPVVRACGGTHAEAVDHILETRVLRKLRDRFDIQHSDLTKVRETIKSCWAKYESSNTTLERSLSLLDIEMQRKQHG